MALSLLHMRKERFPRNITERRGLDGVPPFFVQPVFFCRNNFLVETDLGEAGQVGWSGVHVGLRVLWGFCMQPRIVFGATSERNPTKKTLHPTYISPHPQIRYNLMIFSSKLHGMVRCICNIYCQTILMLLSNEENCGAAI